MNFRGIIIVMQLLCRWGIAEARSLLKKATSWIKGGMSGEPLSSRVSWRNRRDSRFRGNVDEIVPVCRNL
jgi:hypothetical protein